MISNLQRWLTTIPVSDSVKRRQASVFQLVLIGWIVLATLGFTANALLIAGTPPPQAPIQPATTPPFAQILFSLLGVAGVLLWLVPIVALVLLRRGSFTRSVAVAALGLLIAHSIATYALGITNASVLVVFQLPIVLAGLLGGRRLLLTVTSLSIAIVVVVSILESQPVPLAGFFTAMLANPTGESGASHLDGQSVGMLVGFFVAITLLVALLLDRFGSALQEALTSSLQRETELQSIRSSLEQTVSERTLALQTALNDTQARAQEQAQLLAELEQQRLTIKDLTVPVIPLSAHTLVIPLVGVLDASRLENLQEQSLRALERTAARTLILDITGVPVVDTQVAQGFQMTVQSAQLLGADVILVGIRPEVAQTIVGLGLDLGQLRTYSNLQAALEWVTRRVQRSNGRA